MSKQKNANKHNIRAIRLCTVFFSDLIALNLLQYFIFISRNNEFRFNDGLLQAICFGILPIILIALTKGYKHTVLSDFLAITDRTVGVLLICGFTNCILSYLIFKNKSFDFICYDLLLTFFVLSVIRLIYYMCFRVTVQFFNNKNEKRALIVGAGSTGTIICSELLGKNSGYKPICFIDDDDYKISSNILGLKVYGPSLLIPEICKKNSIDTIIFAIPSCNEKQRDTILSFCAQTQCELLVIPTLEQIKKNNKYFNQTVKVDVNKLLGRSPINLNKNDIISLVKDKVCIVTGGGGSIGSEICRQLIANRVKKLIIIDIYENSSYEIEQELLLAGAEPERIAVEILSVRDYEKVLKIFKKYTPDYVFHAAAHKHVPLMEYVPEEAVKNNCLGTYNVALACEKTGVKKMVLISTDKAVNPTNVMGATKRVAELIMEYFYKRHNGCEYVAVRFGNVLGSNGSVIPLFIKEIEKGGPIKVTHPDIIRYFMTIPEAVSLVLKAGALAKGGEVFILDMGAPVKIVTLAENLIKMYNLEPYKDIDIIFTGLRPGEKLYEELLVDEAIGKTKDEKIFIGMQKDIDTKEFKKALDKLFEFAYKNESLEVVKMLISLADNYNASEYYKKMLKA